MDFYNEQATCPKCGHGKLFTYFVKAKPLYGGVPLVMLRVEPEHMLRRCERCGYDWKEAPLDEGDEGSVADGHGVPI